MTAMTTTGKGRVNLDLRWSGMGDAVLYSWVAEGANRAGWDVRFCSGRNDAVLRMFGQTITADRTGFREWGLKGIGERTYGVGTVPWGRAVQAALPFNEEPVRPACTLPDEAIDWAWGEATRERATDEDGPLVILFPGACYSCRTWPLHAWLRLAWALRAAGFNTITLDSDPNRLGKFPYQRAAESIERVAALVSLSDIVICNESGPAHLAGTLDRRALVLCGPSDPLMTMGMYPSVRCMRVSQTVVECVGCHWRAPYSVACDAGCDALHALRWQDVYRTAAGMLMPLEADHRELALAEGAD